MAEIRFRIVMGVFHQGILGTRSLDLAELSLNDLKDAEAYSRLLGPGFSPKADDLIDKQVDIRGSTPDHLDEEASPLNVGIWVYIRGLKKLGVICEGEPRLGNCLYR